MLLVCGDDFENNCQNHEVGVVVIILMFYMFYIEIETKNVFPSFDVSKVNVKSWSNNIYILYVLY